MLQSHQIVQYVDANAQMNASCLCISEVSTNATRHLYNFKVNIFGIHLHIQLQIQNHLCVYLWTELTKYILHIFV